MVSGIFGVCISGYQVSGIYVDLGCEVSGMLCGCCPSELDHMKCLGSIPQGWNMTFWRLCGPGCEGTHTYWLCALSYAVSELFWDMCPRYKILKCYAFFFLKGLRYLNHCKDFVPECEVSEVLGVGTLSQGMRSLSGFELLHPWVCSTM